MSEKFSSVAKLFQLYFWQPESKPTSQARFKPEIFVNFRPEPEPNPTYNSAALYKNNYIALPKFGVYHLTNYYGNRTIISLQF